MDKKLRTMILGSAMLAVCALPVGAQSLMDGLKGQSGKGLPSIGGDMAGNVAGVLQYCVQNKYLGGTEAASIQNSLLDKAGLGSPQKQPQDMGYQKGLSGLLSGDGGSFDVSKVKDDIKTKACDYVLDNAMSLI